MKFLRLFLSTVRRLPIRPPIKTSLDIAPVHRPTSDLGPIQWGQSCIGTTRSDVGQGQCQEKFFMVGRSVGRRGVGRRTVGSFYFFLEPPLILHPPSYKFLARPPILGNILGAPNKSISLTSLTLAHRQPTSVSLLCLTLRHSLTSVMSATT